MTLRTSGLDLTLVSLYLQCSSGLSGKVNSKILAALIDFRLQVKGPFVVGGDWSCPIQEFLGMNICRALKLRVLGTGRPTCGDSELDFLRVSECMEGGINLELLEEVPFRPHAALQFKLSIDKFKLTTPQLPRFTSELLEEPDPYRQVEACLTHLFDEPAQSDEISNRFAGISKAIEGSLWRRRLGVGNSLRVPFQLLFPETPCAAGTAPGHPTGKDGSTNFPEVRPATPRKPGAVFKAYWTSYPNSGQARRRKLPISGEQPLRL